ncbi:protein YIPF6-like [Paramacrobiotus metropolitanus]|uniref:protein YIPF6-like n=1 Tax=Paramacrobiotus metropolitanus TaxID=2943436 RepID=UPI002445BD4F|nr:protein YIPF6-like [Paramacrobiotus metropolitanus]
MAGRMVDSTRISEMNVDMPPAYSSSVEGEMNLAPSTVKSQWEDLNTLDEPIRTTIFRDLKAIAQKFFHVLIPRKSKALLRDWDLWGPLMLTTFIAIMLQGKEVDDKHTTGPEFAQVFLIVTCGAVIVTLNSKLLGGSISFFQSVCILGYCLLPPAMALITCRILAVSLQHHDTVLFLLRIIFTTVGFLWATLASLAFLGDTQLPNRKALAVYPIFLFYLVISWLIVSQTG